MFVAASKFWVGQQDPWIQKLTTIENTSNANSSHWQKWQSG